jgi:hypothetical protein
MDKDLTMHWMNGRVSARNKFVGDYFFKWKYNPLMSFEMLNFKSLKVALVKSY